MNLTEDELNEYRISTDVAVLETPLENDHRLKLYKAPGLIMSYAERQTDRRHQMLDRQKSSRIKTIDQARIYEEIVANLQKPKNRRKRIYANYLQLSEWLREKPADWHQWFMVPCPKGMRCLLVAHDGCTKVYNKRGFFTMQFRSKLPGGSSGDPCGKNKHSTTILDCIYSKTMDTFYALDVIAYANQDWIDCDVSCRFFWLKNKIQEEEFNCRNIGQQDKPIEQVPYVDCCDADAIDEMLGDYPIWTDNRPELDGLLFYHKDSSYVNGTTPLVGWLFAYMVPEILGDFVRLNVKYLNEMPDTYIDCQSYIDEFERNRKQQKNAKTLELDRISEKIDGEDEVNELPLGTTGDENLFVDCEELHSDNVSCEMMN